MEAQIGRLVEAIRQVGVSEALKEALIAAEKRREELRQKQETPPARTQFVTVAQVLTELADLKNGLEKESMADRQATIRSLIGRVEVPREGPVRVVPAGVLENIGDFWV